MHKVIPLIWNSETDKFIFGEWEENSSGVLVVESDWEEE